MIVYHGGYCEIQTPKIKLSRNNKDFGPGFYCTELLTQSERWSRRFDTPVVTSYEYTPSPDLDILNFDQMTEEWLDFIVACRNGTPHSHDIGVGAVANDMATAPAHFCYTIRKTLISFYSANVRSSQVIPLYQITLTG